MARRGFLVGRRTGGGNDPPLPSVLIPGLSCFLVDFGCQQAGTGIPCGDLDRVASWRARTTDGTTLTPPSSGARPVWHANSGYPFVRFDGATEHLGAVTVPAGGQFYGFAFRTTAQGHCLMSGYVDNTFYGPLLQIGYGTGALDAYDPTAGMSSPGNAADGSWYRGMLWHGVSGDGRTLWLNRVQAANWVSSATTAVGNPVWIASHLNGAVPFNGDFGRVCFGACPARPTDDVLQAVDSWLAAGILP